MNTYEIEHNAILRENGAECTVLLKSDATFPLKQPCELALFGSGARKTIKGGTGSGEVNSRSFVTAEEGLEQAGFTITSKSWLDRYSEFWPQAKKRFIKKLKRDALKRGTLAILSDMGAVMPEPDYDFPLDARGDTAIYVLARMTGEGSDRKPVPGDILLTKTEKRDILALNHKYKNFLLVLNVGGVVDLSPVMEVKNILLLSQLGCETGHILADIVLGKSAPSGKLTTTWFAWGDHPSPGSFGEKDDTRYNEGIYVGYRCFDSMEKKPLFPFGYGLGYTNFSCVFVRAHADMSKITVEALVRNTGEYPGKEVVQLYVSQPQGKLDKPYQTLAAFTKSRTLQPGEEQTLELNFQLRDLASYDEDRASWILEPGDYILRFGNSSRDTQPVAAVQLDGEAVIRKVRNGLGKPDFTDWKPEMKAAELPDGICILYVSAAAFETANIVYDLQEMIDPAVETLTDEKLCLMNIGAFKQGGAQSIVGNAANSVAGAAGETAGVMDDLPALVMADGPAGLRLSRLYTKDENGIHALDGGMPESVMEVMPAPAAFVMKLLDKKKNTEGEIFEQYCTAIPVGTALAQSWNTDLAELCGDIVGDEMERFHVQLWLAPALNIHRDIRCGRNYEYYSEDPLISGKIAAAVTKGVQKHPGCGVTVKHFAANNQETNRYTSNSQVSERAMRELYLKGFEIAVRDSQPVALMTSYNLLNGVHTSERRDLIEDILRAEFGFRGVVMTDWVVSGMYFGKHKYPAPNAAKTAAAGNDLFMPGCKGDFKAMMKGLKAGLVSRKQLQINATHVVKTVRKLMKGASE